MPHPAASESAETSRAKYLRHRNPRRGQFDPRYLGCGRCVRDKRPLIEHPQLPARGRRSRLRSCPRMITSCAVLGMNSVCSHSSDKREARHALPSVGHVGGLQSTQTLLFHAQCTTPIRCTRPLQVLRRPTLTGTGTGALADGRPARAAESLGCDYPVHEARNPAARRLPTLSEVQQIRLGGRRRSCGG